MHMLKLFNSSLVKTSRNLCCRCSSAIDFLTGLSNMPKKGKSLQSNFSTQPTDVSVNFVSVEVVGTGAVGAPASVLLHTNFGPYLINCGEGTMKLATEYKIKLHKSPNVFITYPSWKNISGLFGMALAVQEGNGTELFIHGDTDIETLFYNVNKLINLRSLNVKIRECSHNKEYSDGIITAKYVFLYSSSAKESGVTVSATPVQGKADSLDDEQSYISPPSSTHKKSERDRSVKSKIPAEKWQSQTRMERRSPSPVQFKRKCMNYAISYIFKTENCHGSLNFEKCLEHGVPPGPLLGQLKRGIDVTLESGRVVKSVDVKEPDIPGPTIIAVECPSEDFLDSLVEEPAFCDLQSEENGAEAIIHFSSARVIENSKYQEWMNRFPKKTFHIFINEENKRTGSVAIHRLQYKLNIVHPEMFPLLSDSQIPDFPRTENTCIPTGHALVPRDTVPVGVVPIYKDKIFIKCESNNHIPGETLCHLYLRPKFDYDYTRNIVLKKETFFKEMFESEEITQKIEESKQELKEAEERLTGEGRTYPKIVFLGTGSSKPGKVRNGSGILVFFSEKKSILLDCGEFTFGQLINFYGKEKTSEVLRTLQGIYVSHMHLDHHMGLTTLLMERKLAFDELNPKSPSSFSPVFILGPTHLQKWLTLFSGKFQDISKLYHLIPNSHILVNIKKSNSKVDSFLKATGLSSIDTVPVVHCPNSFGVTIVDETGCKITYSGDTRPCEALVDIGMNSDILIHEATLEDAYVNEARVKLHSTTSQAIDVGKRMKAKYILLTHFSQRYCYLPNIDPSFSNLNVGIAFDFMEVPFNKLPLLPMLIKPMKYALSKYDELNKNTTESLLLKREKLKNQKLDWNDLLELKGTPAKVPKITY